MESTKRSARSIGAWMWRRFRLVAGVALLAGLALTVFSNRDAIAGFDWALDPVAIAASIALLAGAPLAQGLTLGTALRRLGARAPLACTLRVWARSFLLRYEPSGAIGFVYRVRERERLGATAPQVLTATGYEQLAAMTAAAIASVGGFVAAGIAPPLTAVLLFVALVGLSLALRPRWLGDPLARWLSQRGLAMAGPLRQRTLVQLVAIDLIGWAATAAGAALLAGAVLGAAAPTAFGLLGALALATLAGALVPLLPAGLGPRDAVLVVALTGPVGAGAAAALALALRVVSFVGELVAVAVAELAALAIAGRELRAAAPAPVAATPAAAMTGSPDRAIVVVPTYDEREALPLFVERFAAAAPGMELLVVDDSSPDGTGELADALATSRPWMHVLHRAEKDGLGMAYRAGFRWCLERGHTVIGQMDCDLSHPPEKLAEMQRVLGERDAGLVLASRYLPGGGTDGWSRVRLAMSRLGCGASRIALGLPYSDLSGGFKLWRAECLRAIDLDELLSAGYAFQVETTQLAHLAGARIEEIPFVFSERIAGASKMTLRISLEGIRVTLALRRQRRPRRGSSLGVAL
ncbi:MAG: dolichol-phosphate mannosyltransferase [Solirubrobacteraceae bacterium]|nr:dolichol-phosphate mannosyltransferase [Solirubrobacteraceae bacterium]